MFETKFCFLKRCATNEMRHERILRAATALLIPRLNRGGPAFLLVLRVVHELQRDVVVLQILRQGHLLHEGFDQVGILARDHGGVLKHKRKREEEHQSRVSASCAPGVSHASPSVLRHLFVVRTCSSAFASKFARCSSAHVPMIKSSSSQPARTHSDTDEQ